MDFPFIKLGEIIYSHTSAPMKIQDIFIILESSLISFPANPLSPCFQRQLLFRFLTLQFRLFQNFVYVESCSVYSFVSGFFFFFCSAHNVFETHPVFFFFFFIVHQVSHCLNIPQFMIFRVNSCEHSCTSHFVDVVFYISSANTQEWSYQVLGCLIPFFLNQGKCKNISRFLNVHSLNGVLLEHLPDMHTFVYTTYTFYLHVKINE